MNQRIRISTEELEQYSRDLLHIRDSLSQLSSQLAGIHIPREAGGELEIGLRISLASRRRVGGETVSELVRQIGRVIHEYSLETGSLSASVLRASDLFTENENRLINLFQNIQQGETSAHGAHAADSGAAAQSARDPASTRAEYDQRCKERAENAYDKEVAKLYEKYVKKINIASDQTPGAYYDSWDNEVYLDWKEDASNSRGECYTYFHEVGHMVDDYTAWFGDSSSSKDFSKALKSDFDNYVNKVMTENNCTRQEAYDHISDWLWEDADLKNGLSDICGGLTANQCSGAYGHDDSYWTGKQQHGIPDKVNNEAFAHFFESSMRTDGTKVEYIKEIFPNAYEEFKEIVRKKI
ncbi:MAG: hypothetical protein IKJ11_09925 [Clostridia bacterium]|nr:hypothetical protein [Clostridia bacterium]